MGSLKAVITVVVSLVGALITALGTGTTDFSDISVQGWLIAAATVLGSGGLVWLTENGPWAPAIKAVMAFLSAGIASLVIATDDSLITSAEWLTALSAAIVATGFVIQATNTPPK